MRETTERPDRSGLQGVDISCHTIPNIFGGANKIFVSPEYRARICAFFGIGLAMLPFPGQAAKPSIAKKVKAPATVSHVQKSKSTSAKPAKDAKALKPTPVLPVAKTASSQNGSTTASNPAVSRYDPVELQKLIEQISLLPVVVKTGKISEADIKKTAECLIEFQRLRQSMAQPKGDICLPMVNAALWHALYNETICQQTPGLISHVQNPSNEFFTAASAVGRLDYSLNEMGLANPFPFSKKDLAVGESVMWGSIPVDEVFLFNQRHPRHMQVPMWVGQAYIAVGVCGKTVVISIASAPYINNKNAKRLEDQYAIYPGNGQVIMEGDGTWREGGGYTKDRYPYIRELGDVCGQPVQLIWLPTSPETSLEGIQTDVEGTSLYRLDGENWIKVTALVICRETMNGTTGCINNVTVFPKDKLEPGRYKVVFHVNDPWKWGEQTIESFFSVVPYKKNPQSTISQR